MRNFKQQLQQKLKSDPHGDTVALQVNPQEADLVTRILKQRGGAGVQSPRTGLLQFYEESGGEGGHGGGVGQGGHNDLGHGGGSDGGNGGNGGGGGDFGGGMGAYSEGHAPGEMGVGGQIGTGNGYGNGNGISINRVAQNLSQNQVYGSTPQIGKNETLGYYGSAPSSMDNALSRLGSFFGLGYHPNAINFNGNAYNSYSADPIKMGLGLGGLFSPFATAGSLAYSGLNALGVYGPQLSWSGVPNPTDQQTASAGGTYGNYGQSGTNSANSGQGPYAVSAGPKMASAQPQAAPAMASPVNMGLLGQNQQMIGYPWYAV
jgi:hypothetical protein